jgi:superfamily II DNA/RNA helicase
VEKRLAEALDDLQPDNRIASFTGATPQIRREELKRRFNADPTNDPLRIILCTDAAREGINLQMRCHDIIHMDLPWNPARLEQRNGRIDRKLQPSPKVWCRYFVYEQREEDVVLQALVRKTELIRTQLGSAGQVIGHQLSDRLEREGITRAMDLAREIDEAGDEGLQKTAAAEMDDETEARRARQAKEIDDLREVRERSREKVGVDPDELRAVFATALARAGTSLDAARAGEIGGTPLFRLNPEDPVFATGGWRRSTICVFAAVSVRRNSRTGEPRRRCAPCRSARQ